MAQILSTYLSDAASVPFAWGQADCMTFAGDWVRALAGRDPVAPWRGAYASETEALELVSRAGGLAALMARGLRSVGWCQVADPCIGDVVCATLPGHAKPLGGIVCAPGKVAFRARRGLVIWPATIVEAWRG